MYKPKLRRILTRHRGDTVGGLGVLQVRLEVGNRVVCEGCVHEVGAPGVLEESGFHDKVRLRKKKRCRCTEGGRLHCS